jgi:hypothetical protein
MTDAATSGVQLHGTLNVPLGAAGLVIFAHGSGSSRHSPRNRQVAATLNEAGEGAYCCEPSGQCQHSEVLPKSVHVRCTDFSRKA